MPPFSPEPTKRPDVPFDVPICIDGRMLVDGATGVARYAQGLAAAVADLTLQPMVLRDDADPSDRIGRWRVALTGGARRTRLDPGGIEAAIPSMTGHHLFRAAHIRFGLTGRLLPVRPALPLGIMHWTYPVPLRICGWANIYTVHDVIPLQHPTLSPVSARRLRRTLKRIVATAARIVTVSEDARLRIIAETGCDPALVVNCYQSIMAASSNRAPLPPGLVPGGYFLYCGAIDPRKNITRLVAAHRASGIALPLVVTGPAAPDERRLLGPGHPGLIRLPYTSRPALEALMTSARALLFPSLAEGFGLPVAEAMAVGCPVLTSESGALAEVAGNAALLVDPSDAAAITRGIRRLATEDRLVAELSERGRHRAAAFDAASFAQRLKAVYQGAIAAMPPPG